MNQILPQLDHLEAFFVGCNQLQLLHLAIIFNMFLAALALIDRTYRANLQALTALQDLPEHKSTVERHQHDTEDR